MRDALGAGLAAAALAFVAVLLTVGIKSDIDGSPETAAKAELDPGRAVFTRMGCGSCHTLAAAGSRGQIGPDLDTRLAHHTRATLIARITAPPSTETFSAMPTDFGARMDARELDALVRFLLSASPER
jgi:cytochrome c oxidase subunit 2